MRVTRLVKNRFSAPVARLGRVAASVLLIAVTTSWAGHAMAAAKTTTDFTTYAQVVGGKTDVIIDIINYIAFLSGTVLVALGLSELRRVVDGTAGGGTALRHPLTKLGFGGMLLAVPYLTLVAQDTMTPGKTSFVAKLKNAYSWSASPSTSVMADGKLSSLMGSGMNNMAVLIDVASFVAFIIGVFFTVRGIQMMRAHIDNPGQSPLAESLKRLAVGGALFSFPAIVNVVYKTFGSSAAVFSSGNWAATTGTTGELDGMMTSFVQDIANPAFYGIEMFCYIAGIFLVLFGLQRLVRTAQDGPRGPLTFGTITMFIVAGCLLSFPQVMSLVVNSIFGTSTAMTEVNFSSTTGVDAAQLNNAKVVFSAVLAFMAVIGFLSVVRGLFLLKSFADGTQQATMMSVVTHIVAGALCVNLGGFLNAVQLSLGISAIPLQFK